jgi:hypothetical protein
MIGLIPVRMFTVSDTARGMAARLQLQVPACRLLKQSCGSEGKDRINYNHLTYLLTPWSRVLLEKLTSELRS